MLNNFFHHPMVRRLRTVARKLGILGILKPILARRQRSYEEAFHEALKSAVSSGDIVWDVGANVGLYTCHFLDWSGETGRVVAFEPLPMAFAELGRTLAAHPGGSRAQLLNVAVADRAGQAMFTGDLEDADVTKTAHLAEQGEGGIPVDVITADMAMNERGVPPPTVVKIDVEGFEEDVLRGGAAAFGASTCRHVLVEMHFSRMDERGLGDSASRIVRMLDDWGYRVRWVDPSHLH
ncbi:MAG: FkbM family methyltransferase, partial [Chthoniobacterales bacterium]